MSGPLFRFAAARVRVPADLLTVIPMGVTPLLATTALTVELFAPRKIKSVPLPEVIAPVPTAVPMLVVLALRMPPVSIMSVVPPVKVRFPVAVATFNLRELMFVETLTSVVASTRKLATGPVRLGALVI